MTTATVTALHAALIPAKKHSSRCPGKNWRDFAGGRNLADLALASIPREMFGSVILSTDNKEFEPRASCELHRRSPSLSTIESDIRDLIREIIEKYELHDCYVWLLNPTSPFRRFEDFERIHELIERTQCPVVISVTPVGPYVWKNGTPLFRTNGRRLNTQDATDVYHTENGMFYVFRAADFLEHGTWYLDGARTYVQEGVSAKIDIDTDEDFEEARRLWNIHRTPAGHGGSASPETLKNETLELARIVRPPVDQHVKLLSNHFQRYTAAVESLGIGPTHTVVDASCGQGYGSYLLAQAAGEVIGLDVNRQYLDEARRCFRAENIHFVTYEDYEPSRFGPADKLVCIETFEHIKAEASRRFIDRVLGYLRPGGDAFFTCPLGDDGPSDVNPFHLNEPGLETLQELLAVRFRETSYRIVEREDSFGRLGRYCHVTLFGWKGAQATCP